MKIKSSMSTETVLQRRSTTTTTEKAHTHIPCWCCCCCPNTFLCQCKSYIRFPVIVHTEIDLFPLLALLFSKWRQIARGMVCIQWTMFGLFCSRSRSLLSYFPFFVCLCKTFFVGIWGEWKIISIYCQYLWKSNKKVFFSLLFMCSSYRAKVLQSQ